MKRHISLLALLITIASTQLTQAREIYPLMNDWRLFSSAEGSGDRARNVALPYCWSIDSSSSGSMTTANYLRTLFIPKLWEGNRVFLKFYGVQRSADIFVNGEHVGEHRGGATAFSYEITRQLDFGEDNTIMARVSSAEQNDLLPTSVEHDVRGGIYRDVEIIVVPQTAISPVFYGSDGVFVTTKSVDGRVVKGDVKVHFVTPRDVERRVEISISDKSGRMVFFRALPKAHISTKTPLSVAFQIDGADLWSPSNPALYDVTVKLSSVEQGAEEVVAQRDEVKVTTGFRTVEIAKDGSTTGTLKINGKPTLMRGVSLYHDNPVQGAILTKETYDDDMEIIKEVGANAIRSAIVPHDGYLYSLCDEEGLMVWIDTPLSRSRFLSDVGYFPTERFRDNGLQQLREIIYQNYNHPSITMWGLFTLLSSRGDSVADYIEILNKEAKKIDPTRPTVALSNENGPHNDVADLIVWRQNIGWSSGQLSDISVWSRQLHAKWSSMRSGVLYGEGGCIDHQTDRSEIPIVRVQNREGWFPEVRQNAMHEEYTAALNADSLFWGVWCSTLFDYKSPRTRLGENVEGLVSFDRKNRKDVFYLYRALWNRDKPTLHIADKRARMVGEGDSVLTLRVYASDNDTAPTAYVNDSEYTMRSIAPSQFVLDSVKVVDRTNVVVVQGDMRDSVEFIYGSPLRTLER